MPIRIAIPEPTSSDADYNARAIPPYCAALRSAGAEPVLVRFGLAPAKLDDVLIAVDGLLLPGSRFDVEPQLYGKVPAPECGDADPARSEMDRGLLGHAFEMRKPVLAICHGVQSLNVWRGGKLVQHLTTSVNHSPGREIAEAHEIECAPGSWISAFAQACSLAEVKVNSSHHQAVRTPGLGLQVTARCPQDGTIEAVELADPAHFVIGVQWHPERTYLVSELSREIFAAFVSAASEWQRSSGKGSRR